MPEDPTPEQVDATYKLILSTIDYLDHLTTITLEDPTTIPGTTAEQIAKVAGALIPLTDEGKQRDRFQAVHDAAMAAVGSAQPWPGTKLRRVEPSAGKRLVAALEAIQHPTD